jgi:hypothetical protein
VIRSLKENHGDEKRYHNEMIAKLQKEYQKLQDRIACMWISSTAGSAGFFRQSKTAIGV